MDVVVTGADGFAGRWLCRQMLAEGRSVSGWVRREPVQPLPGVRYRVLDIRDADGVRHAMLDDKPAEVFHLAAMTHVGSCADDPVTAHETNVLGTSHVFSAMPSGARGLFASTCHVYGKPGRAPIREDQDLRGAGAYARSKIEAEKVIAELGRPVVVARAFHHTGPGQSSLYVLADWAAQIREGTETVRVGDVSVERDFMDVRDVVNGYAMLAREGVAGEAYNVCSGTARPLSYFLDCMTEGRSVRVEVESRRLRRGDVDRFCGDPGRVRAVGWSPSRRIEDTLREMVQSG